LLFLLISHKENAKRIHYAGVSGKMMSFSRRVGNGERLGKAIILRYLNSWPLARGSPLLC